MRAGLSTIQQTLTPEASAVLNRAIEEASRRRHVQTTPLHVAAALLSTPSGHLRQACTRSHPNPSSSHPLQCRALELCFSVALDRLPSASHDEPPPISNALMAALKRAQAHQRRGCPESQQQPLLAVKVELDHLLLSILDDPSVCRVMGEASFSSPTVKSLIESSLSSSQSPCPSLTRNIYLNPRLFPTTSPSVTSSAAACIDLVKVFDVLMRSKKCNPILVGEIDPVALLKEVVEKVTTGDVPAGFPCVAVISTEKEFAFSSSDRTQIPSKFKDLASKIESRIASGRVKGVILDLGDFKWFVQGASQHQSMADVGRAFVTEMDRLLIQFRDGLWLLGTATCATYLRCQVYFPRMETDWDLQALPIAPRKAPLHNFAQRVGNNAPLSSKIDILVCASELMPAIPSESRDASNKNYLCCLCKKAFEHELSKLEDDESEKSPGGSPNGRNFLPHWLRMATSSCPKLQAQELMKKWRNTCFQLHSNNSFPVTSKPSMTGLPLNKSVPINHVQLKLALQTTAVLSTAERPPRLTENQIKTILPNGPAKIPLATKFFIDATSIKRLVNGLLDKVSWQAEAASAVASAVIQSKSGIGKCRNGRQKTGTWLLFAGSDRVGKQKMAAALSDLLFGVTPLMIRLGSPISIDGDEAEESNVSFRGRTSVDRVVEALRVNPFSIIFFEDFDHTDCIFWGTIRRAIERGRLLDSNGREVGLGNAIFILASSWLPELLGDSNEELRRSEERITDLAISGRQLELQLEEKSNKRRREWLITDEHAFNPRKESLSLDLNMSANSAFRDDEAREGSWNSSDLTVEYEHGRLVTQISSATMDTPSSSSMLIDLMDGTIVFKPMDFTLLRNEISDLISAKFTQIIGEGRSVLIDDEAADQMTGVVWLGGGSCSMLDEWFSGVLTPAIEQLKGNPKVEEGVVVKLSSVNSRSLLPKNYLPSVKLAISDGLIHHQ